MAHKELKFDAEARAAIAALTAALMSHGLTE